MFFVVTGATGKLGSQIVEHLLECVPADAIGISVRDVDKAAGLADRGVRVRRGDFTDPETLKYAFEGADKVLVISSAIRGSGAVEANQAAIDAGRASGAQRILYTSHQASSLDSFFAPQVTHAETEAHLAQQGVPFTALRNGFYASTLSMYLGEALETGRLVAPEDGPVSWTAHADLAEAAAVALVDDAVLGGISAPLTAPEMLDFEAVAAIVSDIAGREITRVVVGDDEWTSAAVGGGMPPELAEFTLGLFRASRRGEFAVTDPTLENVIGHRPTPARSVLEEMVSGFVR